MSESNTNKSAPLHRDTYVDLFNGMMKMARAEEALDKFDTISDYALCDEFSAESRRPISSYEFNTRFVVDYGGSEGIYIDGYLDGILDESCKVRNWHFCTLKTLRRDFEAMKIMGETCGVLQYYAFEYLNQNLTRYEPDSAKISAFHEEDVPFSCIHCHQIRTIEILRIPNPMPYGNSKEKYAFRCRNCGAETKFCDTTLAAREKYWNKGEYSIKNNDAILVRKADLQRICIRKHNRQCNSDCARCPLKVIQELRRLP